MNGSQQAFIRCLAVEKFHEFLDVYRRLALRTIGRNFIFLTKGDDFLIFGNGFRRQMDSPSRPRGIDQLVVVDDEDIDTVALTQ